MKRTGVNPCASVVAADEPAAFALPSPGGVVTDAPSASPGPASPDLKSGSLSLNPLAVAVAASSVRFDDEENERELWP